MIERRTFVRGVFAAALAIGGATAASAADEFSVTYQLAGWKRKHFDSEAAARKDAQFLEKNLGCEVSVEAHDGHYDVSYRCAEWKKLTLKSDDEAHEWEAWLKKRGFKTHHTH